MERNKGTLYLKLFTWLRLVIVQGAVTQFATTDYAFCITSLLHSGE